jgi:hypothetical protein
MNFPPPSRKLALALSLALVLWPGVRATAGTLPRLEADSLGGTHVVLPTDAAGKPLVLLLAFTRESEGDLKAWTRKLLDDRIGDHATLYIVVVADKTAFVSRKHIRKMVEGGAVGTKEQIDKNVLITFSGSGWRDLVPPGDKKTVGIVVCDPSGSVVFAKREPFNDANLAEVEKAAK